MIRIPAKVQSDPVRPGYIEILPQVPVYSRELKDYVGSISLSPEADFSFLPGDKVETFLNTDEPFICDVPIEHFGTTDNLILKVD